MLLVNLGTPDATDYWSMRRYLKEFLSDRRVIEVNPVKWWLVLNLIILTVRPAPQRPRLRQDLEQGAQRIHPQDHHPRANRQARRAAYAGDARILVDWAMRYGNPSIAARLEAMQKAGCDRILLVPLYPQYAAATTATVCDKAFDGAGADALAARLRVAPAWFDSAVYIEALAARWKKPSPSSPSSPR